MPPVGAALATPTLLRPLLSKSDPGGAPGRRGGSQEKEKSRTLGVGAPPSLTPQLRLLPGRAASAMRPGRGPGYGLKGQLQETSSSGHVARPPSPPRPLVGSSGRTQSPPFQSPGPRGRAGAESSGRCGCGNSFRGAGFGGRGLHRGPNLPEAEVFFSLTLQAASDWAEPPLWAPLPWLPIWGLSVPPGGAGPGRALGSAPSRLANFAGPAAQRATPRAQVRAGCRAAGMSAGLGDPGCGRLPSTKPPAGRRMETRVSALRGALAGAPGETHREPGGQPPAPGARRLPRRSALADRSGARSSGLRVRPSASAASPLAEPSALRFPGSASGEPLLPAPSRSCGGSTSRGRARRRRRRRRGEGGRALPSGRDWRAASARGGGRAGGGAARRGGGGPEPGPGASPAEHNPSARQRAPSVSGTRRGAAVPTWYRTERREPSLLPSGPSTPLSEASSESPSPIAEKPNPDLERQRWRVCWEEEGVGQLVDSGFSFLGQAFKSLEPLRADGETKGRPEIATGLRK